MYVCMHACLYVCIWCRLLYDAVSDALFSVKLPDDLEWYICV